MNRFFFYFLLIIHFCFSKNIDLKVNNSRINLNPRSSNFTHLVGIMVEFEEDANPETSGNGKFLTTENLKYFEIKI